MKFLEFQKQMREFPIFSIQELRLIFPDENVHTVNTQLSDWAEQGKIVKLKNGLYVLSTDYTKEALPSEVIAAKLYSPSYISLEYALSSYDMIPEAVFEITSVTTKKTRIFETSFGVFHYRKIKASCFLGFSTVQHGKLPYYMASPEKALVDFLYLNSQRFIPEFQTWKTLRIQNFKELDFRLVKEFAKKFQNKKLILLVSNLKEYATSH